MATPPKGKNSLMQLAFCISTKDDLEWQLFLRTGSVEGLGSALSQTNTIILIKNYLRKTSNILPWSQHGQRHKGLINLTPSHSSRSSLFSLLTLLQDRFFEQCLGQILPKCQALLPQMRYSSNHRVTVECPKKILSDDSLSTSSLF